MLYVNRQVFEAVVAEIFEMLNIELWCFVEQKGCSGEDLVTIFDDVILYEEFIMMVVFMEKWLLKIREMYEAWIDGLCKGKRGRTRQSSSGSVCIKKYYCRAAKLHPSRYGVLIGWRTVLSSRQVKVVNPQVV